MVRSVVKMIDGSIPKENLGGPIMIAKMAGDQAKQGFDKLVQFIAFISINLAIINLLPIPVLDGGHLLFFSDRSHKKASGKCQGQGSGTAGWIVLSNIVDDSCFLQRHNSVFPHLTARVPESRPSCPTDLRLL